eukprot:6472379-Amphidinium_carterae.1
MSWGALFLLLYSIVPGSKLLNVEVRTVQNLFPHVLENHLCHEASAAQHQGKWSRAHTHHKCNCDLGQEKHDITMHADLAKYKDFSTIGTGEFKHCTWYANGTFASHLFCNAPEAAEGRVEYLTINIKLLPFTI